jgi:chitinase
VSPWLLIGPVPAGQRAPKPVLLASAKQPVWSATVVYRLGARVIDAGLPYAAKWYTKGDQPSATLPADPQSPWQPLFTLPGEPNATGAAAN